MTFREAAEEVLRSYGVPMSVREITEAAVRQGLVCSNGKTPVATIAPACTAYLPMRQFAGFLSLAVCQMRAGRPAGSTPFQLGLKRVLLRRESRVAQVREANAGQRRRLAGQLVAAVAESIASTYIRM